MRGSVNKSPGAELLVELPFRVAFSAALAVAGICLYVLVPTVESSPYLYVVILLLACGLATWGFRSLRLPAWGTASLRASTVEELLLLALLILLSFDRLRQSLAATIPSLLGH